MRHRWAATGDHWSPGPKYFHCVRCALHKRTDYESKPPVL
jgi:hypothetical protein